MPIHKIGKRKFAWVNERIIDGRLVKFFRNIDDPKDEVKVYKEKGKEKALKLKIKEEKWQSLSAQSREQL
jgi:hypothetical protein